MLKFLPQIIMFILIGFGLCDELIKNGIPREGSYNIKRHLFTTAIAQALLYWGGFYNVFK